MLKVFPIFLEQLKGYRALDKTNEERAYLEADIRGYEEIIKSASEKNARTFMNLKTHSRNKDKRFKNNEEIVIFMKANGFWEDNVHV